MSEDNSKKNVWFDPTINLGHILTFVGFLIAGFAAWGTLDKRLTVMEENRGFQKMIDITQDQRAIEAYTTLRESLTRLERQAERNSDRLDKLGVR